MSCYRVQKYVTPQLFIGVHFLNCEGLEWRRLWRRRRWELGRDIPLSRDVGSGAPEKLFDFVPRNVELFCILDSGAGRHSNRNHDVHDRLTSAHQSRIDRLVLSFTIVSLCCQNVAVGIHVFALSLRTRY